MFKESEAAEFKKAFRLSKNDLGMRPIFHQEEHRVQAHIFVAAMQTAQSASRKRLDDLFQSMLHRIN